MFTKLVFITLRKTRTEEFDSNISQYSTQARAQKCISVSQITSEIALECFRVLSATKVKH
ncbi:hypothetical protein V1478_015178 [Vespula squamosa]|uniref:Uncharacterized protein n=1 Tax=Vespula squamosa TaxID=30214 RepID=A0ABD2A6Q0_VESSQ